MKRRIIVFGKYFGEFMKGLTAKEREKVDYGLVLLKTQDRLPTKFVKHIRDGLYELRTEFNGNIYGVFHFRCWEDCRSVQWISEKDSENSIK